MTESSNLSKFTTAPSCKQASCPRSRTSSWPSPVSLSSSADTQNLFLLLTHQQFLRLNKDGHKSIFLQFYRCYLNISIAEFTLGSAFHKGKPAYWGEKKDILMKMSKHIPIANC